MGAIWSRLRRQQSTREQLEHIEQEIQTIEDRKWSTIRKEQNYAGLLFVVSIIILVISIAVSIYYLPNTHGWLELFFLLVPVAAVSFIIWSLRKTLQWYYRWSLDVKETRLRELRLEKRRILELVIETEKYKVVKELLEKYDPKLLRQQEKRPDTREPMLNQSLNPSISSPYQPTASTRRRTLASSDMRRLEEIDEASKEAPANINSSFQPSSFLSPQRSQTFYSYDRLQTPRPATVIAKSNTAKDDKRAQQRLIADNKDSHNDDTTLNAADTSILNQTSPNTQPANMSMMSPRAPNLNTSVIATSPVQGRPVRPILSQDRSLMDRIVDWVVNDGPSARFALICRHCHGHNGMALQEEFDTLSFRCCFCYSLNLSKHSSQPSDSGAKSDTRDSSSELPAEVADLPDSQMATNAAHDGPGTTSTNSTESPPEK